MDGRTGAPQPILQTDRRLACHEGEHRTGADWQVSNKGTPAYGTVPEAEEGRENCEMPDRSLGQAGRISVFAKSSPLNSRDLPVSDASA